MSSLDLSPDLTVTQLLDAQPAARAILQANGIDTCCGGALTLRQAAEARGITVDVLVGALSAALGAAPASSAAAIAPTDRVRAVIARMPHLAAVFERHGLMGCGGNGGPDERIDLFATIHRIPVDALVAELNAAAARGGDAEPAEEAAQDGTSQTLYRRFLAASLWCTFVLGATFGAYNLLVVHLSLGVNPPVHNWVHASFQLLGFVLLFTMGVSYHALPRFLGRPLAAEGAARATLPLMLAGLLLRSYGQLGPLVPYPLSTLAFGTGLVTASILAWAFVLVTTWQRARPRVELYHAYLGAGIGWWLVAAALLVASSVRALRAGDVDAAAGLHEAFYAAALFGGTLSFILGMFVRTGHVFLALKEPREPLLRLAFSLVQAGTALACLGFAITPGLAAVRLQNTGLVLVAFAIASYVAGTRIFEGRAAHGDSPLADRGFALVMRLAFGGACLFALLASLHAGLELAGPGAPRLLYDGARHAFGLGFVTLAIMGMAGRIIPIFGGAELARPRLHLAGCIAIAAAVLLRQAQVGAALGGPPWLLYISGPSGLLGALGVILAGSSILGTLRASRAAQPESDAPVAIGADANVGALVAAHPETMPILIEAGFAPLANPVLRRTLARAVTLRQACAMHRIDLDRLLERLHAACPHGKPAPASASAFAPAAPAPAARLERAAVLGMLSTIEDPELHMNIVDMGLVYDASVAHDGSISVRMTLTTTGCPHAQLLPEQVRRTLEVLPGVPAVHVEVVFDPPWSPDMIRTNSDTAPSLMALR